MATVSLSSSSSLLLTLALSSLLFSCSSQSTGCQFQAFSNNRSFSNCLDLPHLNSTLHWTFDSKTSNLTLAFSAPPSKPGGWVAWGINPTEPKMIGTQALVAYTDGGAMVVKPFNLSSYAFVVESEILYDVYNLTAEVDGGDGRMRFFATVKLPANVTKINHVWQVGPGLTDSRLTPHGMNPDNLMATGFLNLEGGGNGTVPSPPTPSGGGVVVPVPPLAGTLSPNGRGGGSSGDKNGSVILSLFLLLLCSSIWG